MSMLTQTAEEALGTGTGVAQPAAVGGPIAVNRTVRGDARRTSNTRLPADCCTS